MKKMLYYNDCFSNLDSFVSECDYRFVKANDNLFVEKNLVKVCNSFEDIKNIENNYDHALIKSDIYSLASINYSYKDLSVINGYHLIKILKKKDEVIISERERALLLLMINGKSGKEICFEMKISEASYFNMKKKLLRKTGLVSSQQLLIWALSQLSV